MIVLLCLGVTFKVVAQDQFPMKPLVTLERNLFTYYSEKESERKSEGEDSLEAVLVYTPYHVDKIATLYMRYEHCTNIDNKGRKKTFRHEGQEVKRFYEVIGHGFYVARPIRYNAFNYLIYNPNRQPRNDEVIHMSKAEKDVSVCTPWTKGYLYSPSILDAQDTKNADTHMWEAVLFIATMPVPWLKSLPAIKIGAAVIAGGEVSTTTAYLFNFLGMSLIEEAVATGSGLKASIFDFTRDTDFTIPLSLDVIIPSIKPIKDRMKSIMDGTLTYKAQRIESEVCHGCYQVMGWSYRFYKKLINPALPAWEAYKYKRPPIVELSYWKTILSSPGIYSPKFNFNHKHYQNLWWDEIIKAYEEKKKLEDRSARP